MEIDELRRKIKEAKSRDDESDRITELNELCEEVANHFTECMSILEQEIEDVLDEISDEVKDELDYHDVSDVTRDIYVRASWEY